MVYICCGEYIKILFMIIKSKTIITLLLILLATLNSIVFDPKETPLTGDAEAYDAYATHLALGQGYSLYDPGFNNYREPGYPLFLASIYKAFGIRNFLYVKLFQILLLAGIAFIVYLIFHQFSYRKTGVITAILTALIPYFGYYTNILMSELLFSFLLILSFYLLIRILKRDDSFIYYASLGMVLGSAALTRSVILFFPFFIAVLMLYMHKKLQKVMLFMVIFILLIAVWVGYVHKQTGRFTITEGRFDIHLYTRAVRSTLSYKEQGYYLYSWLKKSALGGKENEFLEKYEEKPLYLEYANRVKNGETETAIEKENIKIVLRNLDGFIIGSTAEWVKLLFIEHLFPPVPALLTREVRAIFYLFLYSFFLFGSAKFLISKEQGPRTIFWISFLYLFYNWIFSSSVDAHSRFNTPYLYFYLMMGMSGLANIFDSIPREKPASGRLIDFFNEIAPERDYWKNKNRYYYNYLEKFMAFLVPEERTVLEIGSGTGDLLPKLNPSYGLGIDISPNMIEIAKNKNKNGNIKYEETDIDKWSNDKKFEFIILSDTVGYLNDVENTLNHLKTAVTPKTKVIITQYSHIWEPILKFGSHIGLRIPSPTQNWLSRDDIENFLNLSGFEVVKRGSKLLLPVYIPILSAFCNRFLVNIFPFNKLAFFYYLIARPVPVNIPDSRSVSIIIPARNEAGMIKRIINDIPILGSSTELIFVENNSTDNTLDVLEKEVKSYQNSSLSQSNKFVKYISKKCRGKKEAVYAGFDMADGDILMIYDADMTVPAEELIKFYNAITQRKGEFINGSRLVYPMEKQSMRIANYIGNKFFSTAFSWLLDQKIKDTLCGTKVLWKEDFIHIKKNIDFLGDFDKWGDFDLLFGVSKLNLKIIDLPIHYKERTYGVSNMRRWKHGILLLRMTLLAAKKIKFI